MIEYADLPMLVNSHFQGARHLACIPVNLTVLVSLGHYGRNFVRFSKVDNPTSKDLARDSYFTGPEKSTLSKKQNGVRTQTSAKILPVVSRIMVRIPHKLSARA